MDHPLRATIIVVDDDTSVAQGLAFTLELDGYAVETHPSGESILDRTLPAGALCLIIDERLPGLSGLETVRRLRADHPDLPALLITTHPPAALRREAAALDTPILEKPVYGQALLSAVQGRLAAL